MPDRSPRGPFGSCSPPRSSASWPPLAGCARRDRVVAALAFATLLVAVLDAIARALTAHGENEHQENDHYADRTHENER